MDKHENFTLEKYVLRNKNYLENMVDEKNQPYFNIFLTDPVSAVHDWPDECDVAVRQLQAAVMLRNMTGIKIKNEDEYKRNFFSNIKYDNGLIYRPLTPYTLHEADIDEQTLSLLTLITLMQDESSNEIEDIIRKTIDTLCKIGISKDNYFWFPGNRYLSEQWKVQNITSPGKNFYMMMVRPLMQYHRLINYKPAIKLAGEIINGIVHKSEFLFPDGTFSGHVHAHLGFLAGVVDYASFIEDDDLLRKMNQYYLFIRSKSTEFGWVPEETGKKSDCIACETCAIMDYLNLAILLAKNGYSQYWDDVERFTRNHLIESQFDDLSWMKINNNIQDSDEITYRDINKRMRGGFAGWSSPNHYLAYFENLPENWLNNTSTKVLNKIRFAQNCCGGSGVRALFQVWKNSAVMESNTLRVNLHFDKLLKEAEIRCSKPFNGITKIILLQDIMLKVRIPEFINKENITVTIDSEKEPFTIEGNYLCLEKNPKGSIIEIKYPLPQKKEIIHIGNDGFQQFKYFIDWKGDSVISINADEENPETGYSSINKENVHIFSRNEGPGKLYQRSDFAENGIILSFPEIFEDKMKISF